MSSKLRHAAAVGVALAVLMGSGSARTVEERAFREVVEAADACVIAALVSTRYETVDGRAFTLSTFEVKETAFGAVGDRVVVRSAGGELDGTALPVTQVGDGAAGFLGGADYLLVLDRADDGTRFVVSDEIRGTAMVRGSRVSLPTIGTLTVEDAVESVRGMRAGDGDFAQ